MCNLWTRELAAMVQNVTAEENIKLIKDTIESCKNKVVIHSSHTLTRDMFGKDNDYHFLIDYYDEQDEEKVNLAIELLYHYFLPWFGIDEDFNEDDFCCRVQIDNFLFPLGDLQSCYEYYLQSTPQMLYKEGVWYI